MKKLNQFITEKFRLSKDNLEPHYNYHPKTKNELMKIIDKLIKKRGDDAYLNDIDSKKQKMRGPHKSQLYNSSILREDKRGVITCFNLL